MRQDWLDLQRYAVKACRNCGVDALQAILSELKGLIADVPQMLEWTLADDTPVERRDHRMAERKLGAAAGQAPSLARRRTPPPIVEYRASEDGDGEPAPPDAYDLAMEAAHSDARWTRLRFCRGDRAGK